MREAKKMACRVKGLNFTNDEKMGATAKMDAAFKNMSYKVQKFSNKFKTLKELELYYTDIVIKAANMFPDKYGYKPNEYDFLICLMGRANINNQKDYSDDYPELQIYADKLLDIFKRKLSVIHFTDEQVYYLLSSVGSYLNLKVIKHKENVLKSLFDVLGFDFLEDI